MLETTYAASARGCLMQCHCDGNNLVSNSYVRLMLLLVHFMMSIITVLIKILGKLIISISICIFDTSSLTKCPSFMLFLWQLMEISLSLINPTFSSATDDNSASDANVNGYTLIN